MPIKFTIGIFMLWLGGLVLDHIISGGTNDGDLTVFSKLAAAGNFTTQFEGFGLALPFPNGQFFLALLELLAWNFAFFEGPWAPIRIPLVIISGAAVLSILWKVIPVFAAAIRGIFNFLPIG